MSLNDAAPTKSWMKHRHLKPPGWALPAWHWFKIRTDYRHLTDPVDRLIGWLDIEPDEELDSAIYELGP